MVRLIGWGALVLVLGACAIANTPQQELAYTRWVQCSALPGRLERVDLDGRITFRYTSPAGRQEMLQCLADAGRAGPPLPEAVGVGLGGGP
jgi:hypothetical protein